MKTKKNTTDNLFSVHSPPCSGKNLLGIDLTRRIFVFPGITLEFLRAIDSFAGCALVTEKFFQCSSVCRGPLSRENRFNHHSFFSESTIRSSRIISSRLKEEDFTGEMGDKCQKQEENEGFFGRRNLNRILAKFFFMSICRSPQVSEWF